MRFRIVNLQRMVAERQDDTKQSSVFCSFISSKVAVQLLRIMTKDTEVSYKCADDHDDIAQHSMITLLMLG